ncbi:MAG TPA: competence/damage-inducible protein A [Candidatus Polarisedimenticolaceae bacterium]|nr:competence/damage-inducible protein A [Candidatus Polarisedimenticolaceae bacterium]
MSAVVLTVGSELLQPGRIDTNSSWLVLRLLDAGVATAWRAAIGDDVDAIASFVRSARMAAPIVVVTGGLGPTEDDRTREALAAALGVPLERDETMVVTIEDLFRARGRTASERQHRQAEKPRGAAWIPNPLGSAPGILVAGGGRLLAALPGVPAEMQAMYDATVAPAVARLGTGPLARVTLRVAGRPESWVDEKLRDLYDTPGTETTILAGAGTVELLLTARGREAREAAERLAALEAAMRERLGDDLYGAGEDTLGSVVGGVLAARGLTLAVAESCTGGLLGAAITDVPGSSAWFRGGVIAYADEVKTGPLGIDPELLRRHGAVSAPVAAAMAAGVRRLLGVDLALAITGIAGPGGGTATKPVGTVHVALDDGASGASRLLDWPGDRALIRRRAVASALDLLRRSLLASG